MIDSGRRNYENTVYVNLETNKAVAALFENDISSERTLRLLEAVVGEPINPGTTLLILDEVQACERALTSLQYFCENAPEYHIAAAGSLLGVAVHRQNDSFPVGKVQSMTLCPLDFEEFLWAMGERRLSEEIHSAYGQMQPLSEALHRRALELYRRQGYYCPCSLIRI